MQDKIASIEVEYQLISYGEIFIPFTGDREHSLQAKFILPDFPFKLFAISTPYSEIPQKICLTFKCPLVTSISENIHKSGFFHSDTAKEFVAFLSVFTRRRIFVEKQIRDNSFPVDEKINMYEQSHQQEIQSIKEIQPQGIEQLLKKIQQLDRKQAESFILATKLYHSAIEMIYTEPEFAYLFLIMCLEAIASAVLKDWKPDNMELYLEKRFPGLGEISQSMAKIQQEKLQEILVKDEYFILRKVILFLEKYLPDKFWDDKYDDAKPNIGEPFSQSNKKIMEWETFKKEELKSVLKKIYNARSELVHNGQHFPASIVIGHYKLIPVDALENLMKKKNLSIPPLITFERLISYSLINFLRTS